MLGNDVVDLADPEVRGGPAHPRFDARVFSPPERRALESESAPNRLRWTLWAAKEAAYKLAVKRDPNAIFAAASLVASRPDRITCAPRSAMARAVSRPRPE